VSLYLAAAERTGIANPDSCIMVAKYESLSTLIFSKEPFSSVQIAKFRDDVKELGFEIVYTPNYRPNPYFKSFIETSRKKDFYARYQFDIRPNTDERPFFFNMLKMRDFLRVFEVKEGQKFNYYATYTLLILIPISLLATIAVLIIPLLLWSEKLERFSGRKELLAYFICIGLAYIMIETALLQRFVLLLEQPAAAASAVVAGLLISSGLGSMIWGRTPPERRRKLLSLAFSLIFVGMALHVFLGYDLIHWMLPWPMAVKVVASAVLILPIGFAMGMPLPAALTAASGKGSGTVAWCWAVNGAASVVASPLAVALAMAYGFSTVLTLATLFYAAAFLLIRRTLTDKSGLSLAGSA
jgi:hypothetical protein